MANPTTNFGWVMPTSTDLVTDLPADFAVFGQGVDTTMAQLKGGTTGQILSKTSATDMAFTWIANDQGDITAVTAGTGLSGGGTSGAVSLAIDTATTADLTTAQTMSNKTLTAPKISTLTTSGDMLYGTGSSVITRLGVGSTGQVLTVSGGVPAWATPAGGKVLQVVQGTYSTATSLSSTTYTDTGLTATITPSATTSKILVLVSQQNYHYAGSVSTSFGAKLLRGSTVVLNAAGGNNSDSGLVSINGSGTPQREGYLSLHYLDSPATTSATVYKMQASMPSGTSGIMQNQSTTSTIILMEIGA